MPKRIYTPAADNQIEQAVRRYKDIQKAVAERSKAQGGTKYSTAFERVAARYGLTPRAR